MTNIAVPLILFALVGGFTALIIYGSYDRKSKVGNGQFDERQLRAQGRAYMWGFYTMAAAGFGVLCLLWKRLCGRFRAPEPDLVKTRLVME